MHRFELRFTRNKDLPARLPHRRRPCRNRISMSRMASSNIVSAVLGRSPMTSPALACGIRNSDLEMQLLIEAWQRRKHIRSADSARHATAVRKCSLTPASAGSLAMRGLCRTKRTCYRERFRSARVADDDDPERRCEEGAQAALSG
jgi:hypothetical protein